jgi:hypothetical protein
MFNQLKQMLSGLLKRHSAHTPVLSPSYINEQLESSAARYHSILRQRGIPRVAFVKQDINEDLYCCPPGSRGRTVVESTLLRSGPAALFSEWDADFLIVETVDDPECRIWQERATRLQWDTLEFFRSYQDRIPGRDYGQKNYAQSLSEIDWGQYDIVISVDNSVPARVTRQFPETLWCYYVRERKAPEFNESLRRPLPGQNLVFSHEFDPFPGKNSPHVLDVPYHLQYFGCLQRLFSDPTIPDPEREGIFVDHHTMVELDSEQRGILQEFGPVASTIHTGNREVIPTSERLARRTLDPDLRERLFRSRYFLCTPGKRRVFGTAIIEAIAAGCLVVGTPRQISCPFLLGHETLADSFESAIMQLRLLQELPEKRLHAVTVQRKMVDWLCFYRPAADLLERWVGHRSK